MSVRLLLGGGAAAEALASAPVELLELAAAGAEAASIDVFAWNGKWAYSREVKIVETIMLPNTRRSHPAIKFS